MRFHRALPSLLGLALAAGCQAADQRPPIASSPSAMPSGAASASPSATPVPTMATLQGIVYDEDLNPQAGVTLSAKAGASAAVTATTGADGRYSVSLPFGTYQVTARKAGFTTRTQTTTLNQNATLDFGGLDVKPANAYFLSNTPEISQVTVEETATGPLVYKIQFSEPLTKDSQTTFLARLVVEARSGALFLRAGGDVEPRLDVETTWDAAGQMVMLTYDEPYLKSGPSETVVYNLRLKQTMQDKIDPVTDENVWDDLSITDAEKNPLGKNRADFVFLKPVLDTIGSNELINRAFGYSPAIRRWNLTHTSTFTHTAMKDETGPGLESVSVEGNVRIGASEFDLMTLRFTEPMHVVRQNDQLEFTRLDHEKEMLIVNVSTSANGTDPQPLSNAYKPESFRFSLTEPNLVYVRFPSGAFQGKSWVEVTLGKDLRDPADNKPDPAKMRASGPVTYLEDNE